jgi:N-acetylglucosaminyl transferase component (Gpi1)
MNVKIFIPDNIGQKPASLCGSYQLDGDQLKFFVTGQESDHFKKIGTMNVQQKQSKQQMGAAFVKLSQNENSLALGDVYLSGNPVDVTMATVVIYDASKFQFLSHNEFCTDNEIVQLLRHIKHSSRLTSKSQHVLQNLRRKFITIFTWLAWMLSPLKPLFDQTAIHQHFLEWRKCLDDYSFDNSKAWTLVADMLAGVCVLGFILYKGSFLEPGIRLMDFTELVVNQLRLLLQALKGSPVGLKLNVLLNNFFLDCFIYHVDLWWTFLGKFSFLLTFINLLTSVLLTIF